MAQQRVPPHKHRPTFTPKYRRSQRKNGRDLAFVEIDRRRVYLGPFGTPKSHERYHRLIAEWAASGRSLPVAPQDITVVEVAAHFYQWARTYYIKHGRVTDEPENIALALRPVKELYGRTPAAEFGPRALKAVRQKMIDQGWTRKYTNRHVDRIKRMLKWAVAEELVPAGVYEAVRAVAGLRFGRCAAPDNLPVAPAPIGLVDATRQHVCRQVAAMIDLQLLTGARPGEIVLMRPCDIDMSREVWTYRPTEHKTEHHGHDRVIFLGPKAREVLAQFLLRPTDAYCFSPAQADQERRQREHEQRVVPLSCGNAPGTNRKAKPGRKPGLRYTVDSYRRAIDRGLEAAFPPPEPLGIRDGETKAQYKARLTPQQRAALKEWRRQHHWHPHQLRHNYATYVRREFGLEAAQILLGHSNADVTQIYAERDMARATTVAAKIG